MDIQNDKYADMEFISNKSPINQDIDRLRENFVSQFCAKMGWDVNSLTSEQFSIIKKNKQYINPNLVLG